MKDARNHTDNEAIDPAAEQIERHRRVLRELAEIGLDFARMLQMHGAAQMAAPAEGSAPTAGVRELALAFDKVSRAVRLSVALEARLAHDRRALATRDAKSADKDLTARRRARTAGAIERAIDAEVGLYTIKGRDLFGRVETLIEREALETDFLDRPMGEIVARICRDLKLAPDWSRWDEDWAAEAEAAILVPEARRRPNPPAASPLASGAASRAPAKSRLNRPPP